MKIRNRYIWNLTSNIDNRTDLFSRVLFFCLAAFQPLGLFELPSLGIYPFHCSSILYQFLKVLQPLGFFVLLRLFHYTQSITLVSFTSLQRFFNVWVLHSSSVTLGFRNSFYLLLALLICAGLPLSSFCIICR